MCRVFAWVLGTLKMNMKGLIWAKLKSNAMLPDWSCLIVSLRRFSDSVMWFSVDVWRSLNKSRTFVDSRSTLITASIFSWISESGQSTFTFVALHSSEKLNFLKEFFKKILPFFGSRTFDNKTVLLARKE